jgi:seryl-tRNA synthetase
MGLTCAIEVWLPSIRICKEVSSTSWSGDCQARRAGIRYRPGQGKPAACIRTPNAAGLAACRLLPAIAGQHQQPDGTVVVLGPLRAWISPAAILHPGHPPPSGTTPGLGWSAWL